MADQKNCRATLLGVSHQQGRALAHLGNTARGRLQLLGEDGLDRVNHHHPGLFLPRRRNNALDTGLGHHLELIFRQTKPAGAHRHLLL